MIYDLDYTLEQTASGNTVATRTSQESCPKAVSEAYYQETVAQKRRIPWPSYTHLIRTQCSSYNFVTNCTV